MATPYYRVIKGTFVIVDYEPDGDSVRFIPDTPDLLKRLHRAYRIRPSTRDGSVQLRFDGIDATELHYAGQAQPLSKVSRDWLAREMGFTEITYKAASSTAVQSAAPPNGVRGAILSNMAEANGRPVSYVLLAADAPAQDDGSMIAVTDTLLDATLNLRSLAAGMSYFTVYTSTPFEHRERLRAVAETARQARTGVWGVDATAEWELDDQASIGVGGQCILPKLFRRCTDYLKAVDNRGFAGNLTDWLIANATGSRSEDDRVVLNDTAEVHLSALLAQRNNRIAFEADLLDIVFVEK